MSEKKPKILRKMNKSEQIKEKKRPVGYNVAHKKAIEKAVGFKPKRHTKEDLMKAHKHMKEHGG